MPPWSTLRRQKIREVGARELRHQTAEVVGSVCQGQRIVVTRHGSPQAVLVGLHDAMELIVAPELQASAAAATEDFLARRVVAVQPPGPYLVLLARQAASAWERIRPRDRRLLRQALVNGEADDDRLLWLSSGRWVVAFSYVGESIALVHQAYEVKQLERTLIGEEIWTRRARRDRDRMMHWRAPWQLATAPDGSA